MKLRCHRESLVQRQLTIIYLEIMEAVLNDSGVYAMTLRRIDGTYSIIKVVTLAVIPAEETLQIRETLDTTIQCHCAILGHIYSELEVSWLVRNKTWKNYGITLPMAADVEHITKVNKTYNGMWQCVVKQNDLNFVWITNMIYIRGNCYFYSTMSKSFYWYQS